MWFLPIDDYSTYWLQKLGRYCINYILLTKDVIRWSPEKIQGRSREIIESQM